MRDDKEKLLDILEAIEIIEKYMQKRKIYNLNEIELAGILRYFEIIGEASHSISQKLKDKYLKIPWRLLKDFRNVLVHQYFDIDLQMVENAINQEIPILKQNIQQIISDLNK
jgi:uncharacterized protein with HEPN domain